MLEIAFSETAANRLIAAQHVGEGPYPGHAERSAISGDGWPGLRKNAQPALDQHDTEDVARHRWENATPLGGSFSDVFCFPDDYSIGPIVGWGWSRPAARAAAFASIFARVQFSAARVQRAAEVAADNLSRLLQRLQTEENSELRMWSSFAPKDYSGTCWLLETIRMRLGRLPQVSIIRLPPAAQLDNDWTAFAGWESVTPEEYASMRRFAAAGGMDTALLMAREWQAAEKQNGSLRAVVNGGLVTVPLSFYDIFIEASASRITGEFRENDLISDVLEQSDLRIGDEWIALRIQEMVEDGRLHVATAGQTATLFSRLLSKGPAFPHDRAPVPKALT